MAIKSRKVTIYAWDTENDWNDENTEVYLVQTAFVGENLKEMLLSTGHIVADRVAILRYMIDKAKEQCGTTYFYCANLKHETELLKEGLKVIQNEYECRYLRRESNTLEIRIIIDESTQLVLWDVLSVFAGQFVKALGKLFGLPKLDGFEFKAGWSKGIDFESEENMEYCYRDAEITYLAAKWLHDNKLHGITVSSIAWKGIKKLINGDVPYSTSWESYFPKLTKEMDEWIRPCYIGGINYSKPDFTPPEEGVLLHEDASSMYPTVAVFDELPYGLPYFTGNRQPRGLWIGKGHFKMKIKENRPDYFGLDKKLMNMDGSVTLTVTSVDYDIIHDIYDVESVDMESYVGFNSMVGLLKDWFVRWYDVKDKADHEGDMQTKTFAKYMLNAPTGRFGLRRELTECALGEDWVTLPKMNEDEEEMENDDSYLPYVAFITANARRRLIQHSKMFNPLIHMDTDSTIGYKQGNMTVGISAMGGWKIESSPVAIIEGGFKRYVEIHQDGSYTMACAGVPQKTDNSGCPIGMWVEILDNPYIIKVHGYEMGNPHYQVKSEWLRNRLIEGGYNPDDVNTMKLMPKKAYGGYIYVPTTMKLNDGMVLRWRK